jgi:hypothetical protein
MIETIFGFALQHGRLSRGLAQVDQIAAFPGNVHGDW